MIATAESSSQFREDIDLAGHRAVRARVRIARRRLAPSSVTLRPHIICPRRWTLPARVIKG